MLTASLRIAKDGQKTLLELDEYRYREALDIFDTESRARLTTLDDIKTLVEWKLWVQAYTIVLEWEYRTTDHVLTNSQAPWKVQAYTYETSLV